MDKYVFVWNCCQPPCEAVSWNTVPVQAATKKVTVSLLVRLWVEMKQSGSHVKGIVVSLLVRLWVEMLIISYIEGTAPRQPPCEAVSWNIVVVNFFRKNIVSLLVRLWVEIPLFLLLFFSFSGQPPCEAVSWNDSVMRGFESHMRSASLWGCELKWLSIISTHPMNLVSLLVRLWVEISRGKSISQSVSSQPPCEAVSWNA